MNTPEVGGLAPCAGSQGQTPRDRGTLPLLFPAWPCPTERLGGSCRELEMGEAWTEPINQGHRGVSGALSPSSRGRLDDKNRGRGADQLTLRSCPSDERHQREIKPAASGRHPAVRWGRRTGVRTAGRHQNQAQGAPRGSTHTSGLLANSCPERYSREPSRLCPLISEMPRAPKAHITAGDMTCSSESEARGTDPGCSRTCSQAVKERHPERPAPATVGTGLWTLQASPWASVSLSLNPRGSN